MPETRDNLAIYGGAKTRSKPMPARLALGDEEQGAVLDLFSYYRSINADPGYQGHFEQLYTDAFVNYMGGAGYADAVCSGTAALYAAVAALRLKPGSRVLVSPVTDPGTLNAIILNQLVPVLVDSAPNSYNVGVEQFQERLDDQISAAIIVHCAGKSAPIDEICTLASRRGVRVIEDCSQAHGASLNGRKVGTFGDIAVFSTMYRKAHSTGGCGGVIFTQDQELFNMVRAFSDRGKPFHDSSFNDKDPGSFLFPALNLNIDEISCAIGIRSLAKLDPTISRRLAFLGQLETALAARSKICRLSPVGQEDSPFFHPITVDTKHLSCTKNEFAEAVRAEGIDVNPDYRYVVAEWEWAHPYLGDYFPLPNAVSYRETTFNLLFNENYGDREAHDITSAVEKVEHALCK